MQQCQGPIMRAPRWTEGLDLAAPTSTISPYFAQAHLLFKGTKAQHQSCHIVSWLRGNLVRHLPHHGTPLDTPSRSPTLQLPGLVCASHRSEKVSELSAEDHYFFQGSGETAAVLLAFLRQWMQLVHGGVCVWSWISLMPSSCPWHQRRFTSNTSRGGQVPSQSSGALRKLLHTSSEIAAGRVTLKIPFHHGDLFTKRASDLRQVCQRVRPGSNPGHRGRCSRRTTRRARQASNTET